MRLIAIIIPVNTLTTRIRKPGKNIFCIQFLVNEFGRDDFAVF